MPVAFRAMSGSRAARTLQRLNPGKLSQQCAFDLLRIACPIRYSAYVRRVYAKVLGHSLVNAQMALVEKK
jgi:hypothetical protein